MSDELDLGGDDLQRLYLCVVPTAALFAAIEAEFGKDDAPSLYNVAVFMLAGRVLKRAGQAERAPDVIAQVWAMMGVPFTVQPKQTQ